MKNEQLLKDIDCFLFDLDGTIYLERTLIKGAYETVAFLREKGKRVIFLTNNSSVSKNYYVKKISDIGIPVTEKDVYTSGNATVRLLNKDYRGKSVYLVGTQNLREEFIKGGITLTEEKSDVVVLGYDKELTYEKLVKATRYLNYGATFIATHPDVNCPATPFYEPDVGSMLALIKESCGRTPDVIAGKPFAPIAEGIMEVAKAKNKKIAMVGDRLSTDIRFGNNNGFLSVLVLSGETKEEDLNSSIDRPKVVLNSVYDIINALS